MKTAKTTEVMEDGKKQLDSTPKPFSIPPGWREESRSTEKREIIFSQGDPCKSVMYIQRGEGKDSQ